MVEAGFTESGKTRFKDTINDYATSVFKRSLTLADFDKGENSPREITHEHVRNAAAKLFLKSHRPKWLNITTPLEYIATMVAGLSGAYLNTTVGLISFIISISMGVTLIIIRVIVTKGE